MKGVNDEFGEGNADSQAWHAVPWRFIMKGVNDEFGEGNADSQAWHAAPWRFIMKVTPEERFLKSGF